MDASTSSLVVVVGMYAAFLFVGWLASRRTRDHGLTESMLAGRAMPLWIAMRRSLSVEWIKDPKAAGGLKLIMRRRGLLPTPTARVRYHMTQLWG